MAPFAPTTTGVNSIIRRFNNYPKVPQFESLRVLLYALLQMMSQSPHILSSKNRVKVRVKVR